MLNRSYMQSAIENSSARANSDIINRVKSALLENSLEKRPTVSVLAKKFGTSTRSLQRSFKAHRVTYTELVTENQKQLAIELLHNSQLSISEISSVLGFSETSVFSRKYKIWYGRSPRDDRKARLLGR